MNRAFCNYEYKRGAILLYFSKLIKARSLLSPYIREILYITSRFAIYGHEYVSLS